MKELINRLFLFNCAAFNENLIESEFLAVKRVHILVLKNVEKEDLN